MGRVMIFAQIKDNVVRNCIVLEDADIQELFLVGYDYLVRIDEIDPRPGPKWTYDGENFVPPPPDNDYEPLPDEG